MFPFSLIYGGVNWCRNKFYDLGFFASYNIPIKSIVVGNLAVGGTGKTPHVAFLLDYLASTFKVVVLSRGYGRTTKGFLNCTEYLNANNTKTQVWITSESDTLKYLGSGVIGSSNYKPNGKYRIKARGAFNTTPVDHYAAASTILNSWSGYNVRWSI